MQKSRWHIFVVPNDAHNPVWWIRAPRRVAVAAGVLVSLAALASFLGIYHYGRMALKVADYNHLLDENKAYRAENHNYRIQTAQLGEKIDSIETTSRKLMVLSGMDGRSGLGGVGGLTGEALQKPAVGANGTLAAMDGYNRSVDQLENRLRDLNERFYTAAAVASARPAFLPVRGYLTGRMGRREDPFSGTGIERHTGIDISAPHGTRVIAPADGIVVFAGPRAGYGNTVVIDHKFGITTRYGHLWKYNVSAGQYVRRNDVLGYVGSTGRATGPHLHFEVSVEGRPVNPLKVIQIGKPGDSMAAAGLP